MNFYVFSLSASEVPFFSTTFLSDRNLSIEKYLHNTIISLNMKILYHEDKRIRLFSFLSFFFSLV